MLTLRAKIAVGVAVAAIAGGAALTLARHTDARKVAPAAVQARTPGAATSCGTLPMRCLDAVDRFLGDKAEAPRIVKELDRVCHDGNAEGCDALVPFLSAGAGVQKDPARAVQLAQTGCDRGDPSACNNLGILYLGGIGVAKDELHALRLFDDLCRKQNQPRACFNAAALYDSGPIAIRDPNKAADYYTQLCNYGDPNSCLGLGNLYLDGRGVAKDTAKAKALYTLACKSSLEPACQNLRLMQ